VKINDSNLYVCV